jgi:sugar phosphate isomerase/epimerase
MAHSSVVSPSPPLAISALTLPRDFSPMSAESIRETIDAASQAGFDAMSISTDHHDWAVADGMSSESFFDYHRERGLQILASEVILVWTASDQKEELDAIVHMLDVSARSEARTVIAATLAPELPPPAESRAWLRRICDLAADRGLSVSFEFLPWTAVPTLASAVRLLDDVDRDNLGLVIDAWHWFRQPGGPDLAALREVAPDRIHLLHLDDAPSGASADLMSESGTARLLPGKGAVGLAALIDVISDTGATPGVVTEVFSSSLRELGPLENARLQHAAALAVLTNHSTRVLEGFPVDSV